jgi:plasmid maintenance system killer protein
LRIPYTEKKNLSEILKNNISILINTKWHAIFRKTKLREYSI